MKLRLLPVLLSVTISAGLLFGGYFAYQSYAMENPLQQVVSGISGVEVVATKFSGKTAEVELKLEQGKSLREVRQLILTEGKSVIGDRELKLAVDDSSSQELEAWWSSVLFEIAQAMETKQYAQIPATLQSHTPKDGTGIQAVSEMDESYVYISISDGVSSKRVMLPRTPPVVGVWPNE